MPGVSECVLLFSKSNVYGWYELRMDRLMVLAALAPIGFGEDAGGLQMQLLP